MKALFAILLVITAASASAKSGNELLLELRSTDASDRLIAHAYIIGVLDTDQAFFVQKALQTPLFEDFKKARVNFICSPDEATGTQALDLVAKHLEQNPETRHLMASILVRRALFRAWPCRENP